MQQVWNSRSAHSRESAKNLPGGRWLTRQVELAIPVDGGELRATLGMPAAACRAGVVVLHGAEAGERSYFLYEHLADLLAQHDVAVLRYDRREAPDGHDVPLPTQAADALAATSRLRDIVSGPVGLWGYSQGAWAATMAAATDPDSIDFLICVSCCGVSPAQQMRVGCANQLRKRGFSEGDVEDLVTTRPAVESYLRTGRNRTSVQATLTWASAQPWFAHAYLPPVLPDTPGTWHDMDYDPQPALDRLVCPVLAFYGESDEWMPIAESLAAWEAAQSRGCLCDLTVVRLPGADHLPTLGGVPEPDAITREYSQTLTRWIIATAARPSG